MNVNEEGAIGQSWYAHMKKKNFNLHEEFWLNELV